MRPSGQPHRDAEHEQQQHPENHGTPDEANGRLQSPRRAVIAHGQRTGIANRQRLDAQRLR